jgi:hypothetical protein
LFGKYFKGRKAKGKEPEQEPVMWLRDLLPRFIEDICIMTYSYPSAWLRNANKTSLRRCAEQFLNSLLHQRLTNHVDYQTPFIFEISD